MSDASTESVESEPTIEETAFPPEEESNNSKNRRSWWMLSILALILAIIWAVIPSQIRDQASDYLQGFATSDKPSLERVPLAQQSPPIVRQSEDEQNLPPLTPEQLGSRLPVTTEEISRLLHTITQLQQQLAELQYDQQQFRLALAVEQKFILRTQLTRIRNPQSRIEVLEAAWMVITQLPTLDEQQSETAHAAQEEAHLFAEQLQAWRQRLNSFADILMITQKPVDEAAEKAVQQQPLTELDHWLIWFKTRFTLEPSPTAIEIENRQLQKQLRHHAQVLVAGHWPEQKRWQHLLQRIQKNEQIMQSIAAAENEKRSLSLPENFDAIRLGIESMRQLAASWLGEEL